MAKARTIIASLALALATPSFIWVNSVMARTAPSFTMRLATAILRMQGKPLVDTAKFREGVLHRTYPLPAPIPESLRRSLSVEDGTLDGHRVVTLMPKTGGGSIHVIYLHGGAYVNELVVPHWKIIHALIKATGATVTVPFYPLAPEHDHHATFAFLEAVYRTILSNTPAYNVVLAGDSAGGGLALGEAVDIRAAGLPLPGRIILFSPWLDITLADPGARAIEPHDVMLAVDALRQCGLWWAGKGDPRDPRLSPLYANLDGLPPIDIFQGASDILVVDARQFAERADQAGNGGRYVEYPGAFHVFVGATFTPEAKDVFRRIGESLKNQSHQ